MAKAPISSSSLSIGTTTIVRIPLSSTAATRFGSLSSVRASLAHIGDVGRLLRAGDAAKARIRTPQIRFARQYSANDGGTPSDESARNAPSEYSNMMPKLASQMRIALASMAWNTGSSSPGELLMTLKTSEVAVCCSSASVSSRVRACTSSNSRVFSMAITAWSAKVVTRSISLAVNGSTVRCTSPMTPIGVALAQQRDAEHAAIVSNPLRFEPHELAIRKSVGYVDYPPLKRSSSNKCAPARANWIVSQ